MKVTLNKNSSRILLSIFLVSSSLIVHIASGKVSDSSPEKLKRAKRILETNESSNINKLRKITEVLDESSTLKLYDQLEKDEILLPVLKLMHKTLEEFKKQSKQIPSKQPFNQIIKMLNKLIILELKKHNGIPSDELMFLQLRRAHLKGMMLEYNSQNLGNCNNCFNIDIDFLKKELLFIDDNVMRKGAQFHYLATEIIVEGIENVKKVIAEIEDSHREHP